jgi:Rieske Fe-S protein
MWMMSTHELLSEESRKPYGEAQTINRRRLLEASFWTCAGVASLAIAGVSTRFLVGHALEVTPGQWAKVDEIARLPIGEMHRIIYRVRSKDAWRSHERIGTLYAFSTDGAEYTVLDGTCTHLGCVVHWRAEQKQFRCPCHDGVFDRTGEVLNGPPPRPLVTVQTKIEEGVLYALI